MECKKSIGKRFKIVLETVKKVMNKKNTYLILLLSFFFVLLLGTGVYFLIQAKTDSSPKYNVDKYEDVTNWCDTSTNDNQLNIDCKALLLEIRIIDENHSCADLQVITKENELKNISICENNEVISYSNDVLAYKKLMPVDMVFTYDKGNDTNDYVLSSVSTIKLEESYIQDIVNKDIANLVTLDPKTTTIQNSVDFCPAPEILPTYISQENKNKYTDFYNNNILTEKEYTDLYTEEFSTAFLENWTNPTIKILFGCESSSRLGYKTICKNVIGDEYENTELTALPSVVSDWNSTLNTDKDLINLKNISLVSDGMQYKQTHANYYLPSIIDYLFKFISDSGSNQIVYCSDYKIYEGLSQYNNKAKIQLEQIRTLTATNISTASYMCLDTLDKKIYSKEGIYLKTLNTEDTPVLHIYNECNNLYQFISNE
ncbi:hypothetical protein KKA50_03280 [Patescibacteria group bacterium]|nr:hypothetical protein [Patescibacteria group bacterium]